MDTSQSDGQFEPPIIDLTPWGEKVIGTRTIARKVVAAYPSVRSDLAVYVDCRRLRVMSSPFIHELLDAWPHATPVGACEDVAEAWQIVVEDRLAR